MTKAEKDVTSKEIEKISKWQILKLQNLIATQNKKLEQMNFQTFTGSYADFLKRKGIIENYIDDLKRDIKFYMNLAEKSKTKKKRDIDN